MTRIPPLKWIVVNKPTDVVMLPPPTADPVDDDGTTLFESLHDHVQAMLEFAGNPPTQIARRNPGEPVVQETLHPLLPPRKIAPEWN